MTPAFKDYRVAELKWNPKNPRGNCHDEQELRALARSLRQRQWLPIIVKEPEMVILEGNRRHAAAEMDGIEMLFGIPVARELTGPEINRMIAQLDLHHQPFSEIARGRLWLSIRHENGWSNTELAEELGVSGSLLTKVFGNLENCEEIQQLVEGKVLSLADGYYLSRIEELENRLRTAREMAAGRITTEGLAWMVRKHNRPANGNPAKGRVNSISCPLPSGVTVTISGKGITLDDSLLAVGELAKEIKRASEQGLDGKTFQAVCRDRAKKEAK